MINEDQMELRHYLAVLWTWVWLLLLAPLLAAGISLAVSMHIQPVYRASATLLISQASGPSLDSNSYNSLLTSERVAKTYAQLLTKRPLLEQVISDLHLKLTPYQLAGKIEVIQPANTQLLELYVEDSDPEQAVAIANGIATLFMQQNARRQGDSSGLTGYEEMLAKQIAEVERDIQALEAERAQINRGGSNSRSLPTAQNADTDTSSLEASAKDGRQQALAEESARLAEVASLDAALQEARGSYARLLESYLQVKSATGGSVVISIVEPAAMPARKVKPRVYFNTFVAGVVGLILAIGFIFLLDHLDDTLSRPEGVEQALRIPTLAAIPAVRMRTSKNGNPFAANHPTSPFAEAHRTLRTNVQFSSGDVTAETLLITSALPRAGKTTTVANLGVVMAQAGMKVLLIDTDLRAGNLHQVFGVPDRPGLTDLLLSNAVPDESMLLKTEVLNLYLLPSGPLPPTPSELLSSDRMVSLIEHFRGRVDVLLMDSPPVLAVTDAAILASLVDGVLLVIESGRTSKGEAQRALHTLQAVGGRVLGAVLTRSKAEGIGYRYDRRGVTPSQLADMVSMLTPSGKGLS
ncbi:MAG: polysaccharide biosynthesis tyrosine autokinase [Chloroflexi bacterium]|nr:MAG: polysaccharide biosynthesis tyrosine autokinase [Chloroflexota bacterium]